MRNHKISTGKKIFVALVATIGFLTFSSLYGAVTNAEITTKLDEPQTWTIDISDTNTVTFQDEGDTKGSIVVTATGTANSGNAANVTFATGITEPAQKAASLLTVNFNNAPSLTTDIDKPASEGGGKVNAHIYAKSEQNGVPAVGIHLDEGANLAITATESQHPTLAAYANVIIGGGSSAATTISATHTNSIELKVPSSLFSSSSSSYYSASSVIGAAAGYGNSTSSMEVSNLTATLGDRNTLISSSFSSAFYSASSVIGSAVGFTSSAVTTSNLITTFGNNNTLTSSSSSLPTSASASSVIGAAVGYGSAAITVSGLTATLGDINTLTSSSSSSGSLSASSVIGSAVGYGNAAITVSGLKATLGDRNTLTSSSSSSGSSSASSIIGAAVGRGIVTTVNNLAATLGDGNTLTSSSSSSGASFYSASNVIGLAVGNGTGTANAVTINMNGSQTLSAVAYDDTATNIKVNTFGADNTDAGSEEGDFGWRVGIFAAGEDIKESVEPDAKTIFHAVEGNSTVNILGAKLSSAWAINGDTGVATATLGGDQGTDSSNYARAFALGNDFKIYIGGRANANGDGFTPVSPAGGTSGIIGAGDTTNVVNIIGAISKGKNSTGTEGSSLTVDSGWTVNAFGPVEDLAEISVTNGSYLNIYGPMRNNVISGGEVMVYGTTTGIGTIELREGNLHLSNNGAGTAKFNDAIGQIAGKMTYVDPATGTLYKGSDGKIAIEVDPSYPWKGADAGGQLTLSGDDQLVFHVDSSQPQSGIESVDPEDHFALAKGFVAVDTGMEDAIVFDGGNFGITNDDNGNPGQLPAHTNFWLIRSARQTDINTVGKMLGFSTEDLGNEDKFKKKNDNLYKMTNDYANEIFSNNPYTEWNEALGVYIFNDSEDRAAQGHTLSGLLIGTGTTPRYAVPTEYAKDHANGELASLAVGYANAELASLSVDITTLVSKTLSDRMASAKGWFGAPFINIIYEHSRQAEIAGFGYNNNTGGFLMGIDNIWTFPNEKYLSLGAAFGYIHGKTNFFGSASGLGKSAKHDAFTLALFSAYELFNDKNLKTNIRLILGYSHGKDSLSRTDPNYNDFSGNLRSNNAFLGLEFVKNLYAHNGCQFGLWCRANYSRIAQKGYDESSSATMGAQHVSAINHNFLATVVGINIEKEVFNPEYADRKLTLSLKAGWESQIVRKHSDARVSFDGSPNVGEFSPILGYPARNAAIVSLGASKKLNVNWSITGSYVARFNRDISIHNLSCGIKYSF